MSDDIEQQLKINTLEGKVGELNKSLEECCVKIDKLRDELTSHMKDEDLERRATDKKLNLHTVLLVAVGLGATGADLLQLVKVVA